MVREVGKARGQRNSQHDDATVDYHGKLNGMCLRQSSSASGGFRRAHDATHVSGASAHAQSRNCVEIHKRQKSSTGWQVLGVQIGESRYHNSSLGCVTQVFRASPPKPGICSNLTSALTLTFLMRGYEAPVVLGCPRRRRNLRYERSQFTANDDGRSAPNCTSMEDKTLTIKFSNICVRTQPWKLHL